MEDRLESSLIEVLGERESGIHLDREWLAENYPLDGEELSTILALDQLLRGPSTSVVRLGPYELSSEIGRGGMGTVYRATVVGRAPGLEIGETVAVKIIHPQLLENPTVFRRLLREAAIGARVRHPNVVPTYDMCAMSVDGESHHFLVMAYERGRTLRAVVSSRGALDEASCRGIALDLAAGLSAIHAAGAVHRDVKPANVIVTEAGDAKLMDLGVALDLDDTFRLTRTGRFVGTRLYAAPEQLDRSVGPVDARADLYSLGLTLYFLATGQHPFPDARGPDRVPDVTLRAPSLSEQSGAFTREFETLVTRLLEPHPDDRFASAAELQTALGSRDD